MKKLIVLLIVLSIGLYSGINWARDGGRHGGGGYYGHGGYGGGYHGHRWYGHSGGFYRPWRYGRGYYYGYPGFSIYFGAPYYSYGYPYYGYPFYGYPYYGYPYYYPPGVATMPGNPPVYIQKNPPAGQNNPSGYWYYCPDPQGYYPDIKECPNGWQQVQPSPPSAR